MKKRVGTMLLMVLMAIAVSTQAFAAAPSTMSEERQAELKAELRGIVEEQARLGGLVDGVLNSSLVRNAITEGIQGMLNSDALKDLISGPALGDLIGDALPGDLGSVIGDVLSNEDINNIIGQILENKYFGSFLDRTIDNILADIDLVPFVNALLADAIDAWTDEIWNDGDPRNATTLWLITTGHWDNTNERWVVGGITTTVGAKFASALLSGNFSSIIDVDNLDFGSMLGLLDTDLILNAAKKALVETFDEFKEDFKAEIRAKVEEKLAEIKDDVKAKLTARLIEELNDTFGTDFDSDATQEEMMEVLNPIFDALAFEKGGEWIAKLNGIRKIAGLLKADTDCIDQIIACIEARSGNHAELLSRTVTVNFPGIEGVTVQYYTTEWTTVGEGYADSAEFVLPEKDANVQFISVTKGGMVYDLTIDALTPGKPLVLDVPVITLRAYGVNAECNLGVAQSDWVYRLAPVGSGVQTLYPVFDNGENYTVTLSRDGFHPVYASSNRTVFQGVEELHAYFGGPFYGFFVPEGFSNIWIASNDWCVRGANAGDRIILLQDYGNFQEAKMSFVLNGKAYSDVTFPLDGTDPFADICDLIGHDWDYWVDFDPTCVADGYREQRCAHCDEIAGFWEYDTGSALGHDFGDFWDLDFSQSRLPHLPHANDPVGTCKRCDWYGYVFAWEITEVEPTCVADGYTRYVASTIPNSGYAFDDWATAVYDDGSAFGHDFSSVVWDGFGWWASGCRRCGWSGYLSYEQFDPDFYTPEPLTDAEALLEFISGGVTNLTNNLSLAGKVVTLFFGDGREIVLSTNANNLNVSGEVDLGDGFWLVFDIKGNGSNIKEFKVVQR